MVTYITAFVYHFSQNDFKYQVRELMEGALNCIK